MSITPELPPYEVSNTTYITPDHPQYGEIIRELFLSGHVTADDPEAPAGHCSINGDAHGVVSTKMPAGEHFFVRTAGRFTVVPHSLPDWTDPRRQGFAVWYVFDYGVDYDGVEKKLVLEYEGFSLSLDLLVSDTIIPPYLRQYFNALKHRIDDAFKIRLVHHSMQLEGYVTSW